MGLDLGRRSIVEWAETAPEDAAAEFVPAQEKFTVETVIGFVYAWAIGDGVALFGIPLPALLPKSEPARMSMGYFHSALGFYYLMLLSLWFAYGFYQHIRYRSGIKRLFPGASV